MRVLLFSKHPVVRAGLRACLEVADDIRVAGQAADERTATELARDVQPEIAVLSIDKADDEGFRTAERLCSVSPATRLALLSASFDTPELERGIALGARGLILKTETGQQLIEKIREIHGGGYCCSEELRDVLIPGESGCTLQQARQTPLASLNKRERAILFELGCGVPLKRAALSLGISYKAADHLKQSVMKKLDIHDRADLVRFAIRERLVCGFS
ncbi:MAG TPA: response regulator transcription factor [Planctomycetaceae bacterium]|jgi:DNA-binding NarL/FixJ family response regulator